MNCTWEDEVNDKRRCSVERQSPTSGAAMNDNKSQENRIIAVSTVMDKQPETYIYKILGLNAYWYTQCTYKGNKIWILKLSEVENSMKYI